MTLYPQARAFFSVADDLPGPGQPGFDLEAARRSMVEDAPARLPTLDGVEHVSDHDATGVPVRLYRPRPGSPVAVFAHGGGWVMGNLDSHDAVCRLLAARSGVAVLAVDYRLAPEHPFPAPLEDVETAVEWLGSSGEQLQVRTDRLAVVGDSSGGNLAAATVLRARDRLGADSPFVLQALIYPPLDSRCGTDSFGNGRDGVGLDPEGMRWFWASYASEDERRRPDVAPALADDVTGLPPAVVITAEHDVLRDEGEAYAARLAEAGGTVVAMRCLGMPHGFWRRPLAFDPSLPAIDVVAGALGQALG